jgi:hypothetical protein
VIPRSVARGWTVASGRARDPSEDSLVLLKYVQSFLGQYGKHTRVWGHGHDVADVVGR